MQYHSNYYISHSGLQDLLGSKTVFKLTVSTCFCSLPPLCFCSLWEGWEGAKMWSVTKYIYLSTVLKHIFHIFVPHTHLSIIFLVWLLLHSIYKTKIIIFTLLHLYEDSCYSLLWSRALKSGEEFSFVKCYCVHGRRETNHNELFLHCESGCCWAVLKPEVCNWDVSFVYFLFSEEVISTAISLIMFLMHTYTLRYSNYSLQGQNPADFPAFLFMWVHHEQTKKWSSCGQSEWLN